MTAEQAAALLEYELARSPEPVRGHVADLVFSLGRARELREHAVKSAGDAIEARELANRDRDAAARELAAALAERDAARTRAEYPDSLVTVGVLGEVAAERKDQDAQWGEQNHPSFWPDRAYLVMREDDAKRTCDRRAKDGTIAYADIFVEEVAEVLGTIVQGSKEARRLAEARTRAELVQVAAVAVAWVEAIDRREVTQ